MIHNLDRSGYFGSSDTRFVMNDNHQSKTWKQWWQVKMGEIDSQFGGNIYTRAGNMFEHKILLAVDPDMTLDGQIIHERYLLRTNFDGWKDGMIYECKTHRSDKPYEISNEHWMQVQSEMFIYQQKYKEWFLPPFKGLEVISYGLDPSEYYLEPDEIEIDESRILHHKVVYDKQWVKGEYLPRLKELARSLKKGKFPL